MNVDARAEAWATLQLCGVAPRPLVELLRAFGHPEAVLAATPAQRRNVVAAASANALEIEPPPERLAATLAWLGEPGHSLVAWDDADYPRALLEIGDPPPVFYCLGERRYLGTTSLAIVGSRNATPQGCANAEAFAAALSAAGITIVSGLYSGLDYEDSARFSFLLATPIILAGVRSQGEQCLASQSCRSKKAFTTGSKKAQPTSSKQLACSTSYYEISPTSQLR